MSRRVSVPDPGRAVSGPRIAELAIPAALAGLVGVLYSGVLRLWWTYDDFYVIHLLKIEPRFAYWLKTDAWSQTRMFTPLLLSSFELDAILAGLTPRAFYVHQLLALAAAAVALYVVLRLWLPRFWAGAVGILFLVGAPTVNWVERSSSVTTPKDFVAALVSLGLFTVALRRNDWRLVALSALAYLIAMLAKEVYVPLVALLAVLPEGRGRRRIAWLCRAHLAALAIYVAWRWTSTGTLVGGYGWTVTLREMPGLLARLPVRIGRSWLGGQPVWGALLLAAIVVAILSGFRGRRRAWALAGWGFLLVSLPVLPVSKTFHLRYGGLPWLAACVALGFAGRNLAARGGRASPLAAGLLVGVATAAALAINRSVWEERQRTAERMSAEEIFYVGMSAKELLRQPLAPPAAMKELRWYKENVLGHAAGAGWFADDFFACAGGTNGSRIWGWDARRKRRGGHDGTGARRGAGVLSELETSASDRRIRLSGREPVLEAGSLRGRRVLVHSGRRRRTVRRPENGRIPKRFTPDEPEGSLRVAGRLGDVFARAESGSRLLTGLPVGAAWLKALGSLRNC